MLSTKDFKERRTIHSSIIVLGSQSKDINFSGTDILFCSRNSIRKERLTLRVVVKMKITLKSIMSEIE